MIEIMDSTQLQTFNDTTKNNKYNLRYSLVNKAQVQIFGLLNSPILQGSQFSQF